MPLLDTNESKERLFSRKLQNILKKFEIKTSGEEVILVYNSPYRFINRKNEILIPIIYKN